MRTDTKYKLKQQEKFYLYNINDVKETKDLSEKMCLTYLKHRPGGRGWQRGVVEQLRINIFPRIITKDEG